MNRSAAIRSIVSAWPSERPASGIREAVATDGRGRVQVAIETGRTHQIRVHLAHVGTPVLGDVVYGDLYNDRARRRLFVGDWLLLAWRLG